MNWKKNETVTVTLGSGQQLSAVIISLQAECRLCVMVRFEDGTEKQVYKYQLSKLVNQ